MRAQVKTPVGASLPSENVSLSRFSTHYQESCTGFPGGRVFCHYSNSTLVRSLVAYSEPTFSSPQQ